MKDNSEPVIFCVSLCNSGTPPDSNTSVVRTNDWFHYGHFTVQRDPLRIFLLAVYCETTLPILSIHTRLTVPKDRNRRCCTTHFGILSSRSVVLFGRQYLAILAQLPVCMNLRRTKETVLRLMFICMAIWLGGTSECRMLRIVRLRFCIRYLPHPIMN